jgi:uncharacterized protein YeaO (DUF488 family)
MLKIKCVYEKPESSDGLRVLIDRLWPMGISKDKARIERWIKEIANEESLPNRRKKDRVKE